MFFYMLLSLLSKKHTCVKEDLFGLSVVLLIGYIIRLSNPYKINSSEANY